MKETIKIIDIKHNRENKSDCIKFGVTEAEQVREFHKSFTEYDVTPLVRLDNLAKHIGIAGFFVKDESYRFGLNAFKVLGGSYAMAKYARGDRKNITFVTATDGNHGRGVAWAASRMGCDAYVYLPKGTATERLQNILRLGVHAEITDLNYDDAVRHAMRMAEENGWILIQDTSWPGYEDIPTKIMQGYTTMGTELKEQLGDVVPTHIFLQAGVGAMAGAMTAYFSDLYGEKCPKIIIVEPERANCIFMTAEASDGQLHYYTGEMDSIMAGLCCGEPCTIAWDILKDYADYVVACSDVIAEKGMRLLGKPFGEDKRIVSGESGAVTTGLVAALMTNPKFSGIREQIGLSDKSIVLCISTEGDTDKENYNKIVFGQNTVN
ncbi:MAG: diaminopropionate ammonia-lyase [Lachnospiraceae bacterium]|nr:diaminopropionate ammonia-lyase [Lachnospiraceae bacterium]